MLLVTLLEILQEWQAAFARQRSYRRAVAQALGTVVLSNWALMTRLSLLAREDRHRRLRAKRLGKSRLPAKRTSWTTSAPVW